MAIAKQVILTSEGLEKLEKELEYLKTEKRQEIAEKIKVALGFGDLSENSEYDEAKNEQAQVEIRIVEIESMLKNAKVIDENDVSTGTVSLGCKVKVLDMEFDETEEYSIVGSDRGESQYRQDFRRIACRRGAAGPCGWGCCRGAGPLRDDPDEGFGNQQIIIKI